MQKSIGILGCGWLGMPTAKYFIKKGWKVKGSTTTSSKLEEMSNEGIEAFLMDLDKNQFPTDFFNTEVLLVNIPYKNVVKVADLVEKIKKSKVEKVIYISSTSVYKNNNDWVTEDDDLVLKSPEEHPLVAIENLFLNSSSFTTSIVRFSGLLGGKRHPKNFFASRPIPQPNAPVNMIMLEDCIKLIDAIITQEKWGEIYNGCSDEHPSKKEYYTNIKIANGLSQPKVNSNAVEQYKTVSNEKAKKDLNLTFSSITKPFLN